jgi:hypothetical protein
VDECFGQVDPGAEVARASRLEAAMVRAIGSPS